jgi:hypothetical protein
MTSIPDALADALREYVARRRESTASWGRGVRGRDWLDVVSHERKALAHVADAALEWADSQQPAATEPGGAS